MFTLVITDGPLQNSLIVHGGVLEMSSTTVSVPSNSSLYALNLQTGVWSNLTQVNHGPFRYFHTMKYYNSVLWVYGGISSIGVNALPDLWKYDPVSFLWTTLVLSGSLQPSCEIMNSQLLYSVCVECFLCNLS